MLVLSNKSLRIHALQYYSSVTVFDIFNHFESDLKTSNCLGNEIYANHDLSTVIELYKSFKICTNFEWDSESDLSLKTTFGWGHFQNLIYLHKKAHCAISKFIHFNVVNKYFDIVKLSIELLIVVGYVSCKHEK